MKHMKSTAVSLPTKEQIETERKRYRRKRAYNKALSGTVYVHGGKLTMEMLL